MDAALKRFADAVAPQRAHIDLAHTALLCALIAHPNLDVQATREELNALAVALKRRLPEDFSATHRLIALNNYLFKELGFSGNHDDYYNPANSYLNEVIQTRRGIPITLAIVYLEVGKQLGLKLDGVSFPGHFLVKTRMGGGEAVLDPFEGGRSLSEEELRVRLARVAGSAAQTLSLEDFLEAASPRLIIARLLRNLKAICIEKKDHTRALAVLDRLVILLPDAPEERRDRGLVYAELECPRAAVEDLGFYCARAEGAPDAQHVAERLAEMTIAAARLN